MAFTSTATSAEFRTAWQTAVNLEIALRSYAQGDANKDKPGRFTEEQVQAAIDAVQDALTTSSMS